MKAVVLLSGGLDSAVCLWWALKKKWRCTALSFDYGQRHNKELKQAALLARKAGVPHRVVRFTLPWSKSTLTSRSSKLPQRSVNKMSASIPSTYVPGRNTIFLSFAMSLADQEKASVLVIGANAVDYSGYPDCRGPYLRSFEQTATLGSRTGAEGKKKIKIAAPLLRLKKSDIIKLGYKLGAPVELTWSCYKGGKTPCGRCDSCVIRSKGFEQAGRTGR